MTYGLLIVVGVIWYQVFIRVKSNVMGGDEVVATASVRPTRQFIHKREDFRLAANYRDPFSGKLSAAENSTTPSSAGAISSQPATPKPPKPTPPPFVWPAIRYYGMVRETTSAKPLTVLTIDGEFFKLKQGEGALDDIYVKKTYRDSVVIQYKKRTKVFYKEGR